MTNEPSTDRSSEPASRTADPTSGTAPATRPSLQRRILIWQTTLLVVVVVAFGGAIFLQQRHARMRDIDSDLRAAVEVLRARLQAVDDTSDQLTAADLQQQTWDLPDTLRRRRTRHAYERPYLVIRDADNRVLVSTAGDIVPPVSAGEVATQRNVRGRDEYREAWGDASGGRVVLVGRHVGADFRDLRELALLLVAVGGLVLLAGIGGAWWLSRRAVAPIAQISQVAARLSQRSLDERIDATAMDVEFERLASALNDALQRLEEAFAQQVQFTADASHELRTPLAVIRMHQDLALSKERSTDEYRQALETCGRSTARMSALVEGLLELARLDAQPSRLRRSPTDLPLLIRDVVQDSQVLAAERSIHIAVVLPADAADLALDRLSLDQARISQVLLNLLSNAMAYSPIGGQVEVRLEGGAAKEEAAKEEVRIIVQDEGPGIAIEDRERVFERFYRVDSERSRQTGGSGLGLSICRAIVQAHGGRVFVEDTAADIGTRFTVCLPVHQSR